MKLIITQSLPQDSKAIRQEVFVEEQEFREEFDDKEENALHAVLYLGEYPVATARAFPKKEDASTYRIGRIAVKKQYRGLGLGQKIVEEMERYVQLLGAKQVELSAQTRAIGFYQKLGYQGIGEPYFEEHVPHILMHKQF